MESPEVERYGPEGTSQFAADRRAPNPNRDYKRHFQRQKERYTSVTAEQQVRKKELSRASLKQIKLEEEVEFLVDAIAGERHRRQQRVHVDVGRTEAALVDREASTSRLNGRPDEQEPEPDPIEALVAEEEEEERKNVKPDVRDSVDQELDDLLSDGDENQRDAEHSRRAPISSGRRSGRQSASQTSHAKRQRAPSNDTDDELLASAGLSASKRARNG